MTAGDQGERSRCPVFFIFQLLAELKPEMKEETRKVWVGWKSLFSECDLNSFIFRGVRQKQVYLLLHILFLGSDTLKPR